MKHTNYRRKSALARLEATTVFPNKLNLSGDARVKAEQKWNENREYDIKTLKARIVA